RILHLFMKSCIWAICFGVLNDRYAPSNNSPSTTWDMSTDCLLPRRDKIFVLPLNSSMTMLVSKSTLFPVIGIYGFTGLSNCVLDFRSFLFTPYAHKLLKRRFRPHFFFGFFQRPADEIFDSSQFFFALYL